MIVIGCGGAGKSTFPRRLGEILKIPVFHLDKYFWKSGWERVSREEFINAQEAILGQPQWIVDGNYGGTLDNRISKADVIVFFDFPMLLCLWGAVRRWALYYILGHERPDMTAGNHEKLDIEYVSWILNYRQTRRAGILQSLSHLSGNKEVVVFRSRTEVETFLRDISCECF